MSNKDEDFPFLISSIKIFSLLSITWFVIWFIEIIISKNYTIVNFVGEFPIINIIPLSLVLSYIFHILPRYYNTEEHNLKLSIGIYAMIFIIIIVAVFLISPHWTIMSPRWIRLFSLGPDVFSETKLIVDEVEKANLITIPLLKDLLISILISFSFIFILRKVRKSKDSVNLFLTILLLCLLLFSLPALIATNSYVASPGYYLLSNLLSILLYVITSLYFLQPMLNKEQMNISLFFTTLFFLISTNYWLYYALFNSKLILIKVKELLTALKLSELHMFGENWRFINSPYSLMIIGSFCIIVSLIIVFVNIRQKEIFKRLTFLYLPIYFLQSFGFYILLGSIPLKFFSQTSHNYFSTSTVHAHIFGKIGLILLVIASIVFTLPILSLVLKKLGIQILNYYYQLYFPKLLFLQAIEMNHS